MKSDPRILALPLTLALALGAAACGGGSSTATSGAGGAAASAATQASAAAQPTEAASAAGTEAPAPPEGNESSVTAGGITMPARVGGVTYTTNEYTGDRLAMFLPFKSDELDRVLDAQGKTRDDTVLAIAAPDDFAWPTVNAIRISGGDGKGLFDQIQNGSSTGATWEQGTIGGKSVAKATNSERLHDGPVRDGRRRVHDPSDGSVAGSDGAGRGRRGAAVGLTPGRRG